MATEEKKNQANSEHESDAAAQQIVTQAMGNLSEMGGEVSTNEDGKDKNDRSLRADPAPTSHVAQQFVGLPMRELIAGPLLAAAEAQEKLAATALKYYEHIAYDEVKKKDKDGKEIVEKGTRMLTFDVNRPVEENGQMVMKNQQIQAPFIGLVPIPSLLIDRIDVDFQMEVTETTNSKETSASEASTDVSAKWFTVNASVHGKVSSSRENTRTSNQTAKYQIHVSASQQKQTEGLSKLMDIMASCIEPMPVTTT